jgi:ribosome biogenesis GTPase
MKNNFFGQVYKAYSNAYIVKCDNELIKCVARGVLKLNCNGICVGDVVNVSNGVIVSVNKRKNHFIRPNVSNIDAVVAVFAPIPKPDFCLVDKLLINATKENAEFVLVVNKCDVDPSFFETVKTEYVSLGIKVFGVSAKEKSGLNELKNFLSGKLSVLAGQSAVGKTSIINAMFDLNLKTGELSEKINRGKHTTTRSEIFEYQNVRIIDSPGFAILDADVRIDELPECYPDYFAVSSECKYRGCKHISEPNCRVKELVSDGVLSKERYERYIEIYNELLNRRVIYEKN